MDDIDIAETGCQCSEGKWGEPCPCCGQVLPVALPWGYGRPCSKPTYERGRGWDGREVDERSEQLYRSRWGRTPRS